MTEDAGAVHRLSALEWLWGARVQRVDEPIQALFALTLYDRGHKQTLLLAVHARAHGVGVVETRPLGLPASPFARRLRVALENSQLTQALWLSPEADERAAALELTFVRHSQRSRVVADFHAQHANLFLLGDDERILGAADERARRLRFADRNAPYSAPRKAHVPVVKRPEEASAAGSRLLAAQGEQGESTLRKQARTQAQAALRRAQRKATAIRGDLARAETAPRLRREASLLLCHLASVPTGANQVELVDLSVEPPEQVPVSLDPALSAQRNAESKFTRARRLERGTSIASARLAEVELEIEACVALLASIDSAEPETLADAAGRAGIRLAASQSGRARPGRQAHTPYRVFVGFGDTKILVGKSAADNDTLTLTVARPHDVWLHARSIHGAHVVVRRERNTELHQELLLDAAHLAAHFSDARAQSGVEIQHTERRYLHKAKGSAAGAVRVDRERVLLLRVEPERLRRLLASEQMA